MALRIGSGKFKGRRLFTPQGKERFSSGRTKKALFDFLSPYLDGADVLDLFAGAGGLGIEALSRGARFCLFVEVDARAAAALKKNLAAEGLGDSHELMREDFRRTLENLFAAGRKFDLVLADPPYRQEFLDAFSSVWSKYPVLRSGGWLALEHSKRQNFVPPENLLLLESRRYGDTMVSYFRPRP
ncbi:MAG: 16S rRNA (guanine(966)-N(2))-methyltransferase RsmD [candidate division Zixibacteria bacterium]|nr:16S rRNA (guanine(966)-N(2))-methyltransferase RsmD [candidate division Zixibacteria bacterium]MCI0596412.1 16S rRNA (guanine(966)-N(2))-methyltransferase RsmD [candidate division Zixibacteria bacterium]